nr:polyamine-modulated factor 1-binding protein 1 [Cavia porcellus]
MLKLKGELRASKGLKGEVGERDRDVNSLNSKLLSLQLDIKNLHDVCKRQGKTLQENQLCVEEAMMNNNSHNKKQAQTLPFEESQVDFGSTKECHLRQLQQLKKKLLALQQELEFRTEELQTSYCSLLQYQSILEKQTSDLVLLHHHCKLKEDEVTLYEEEMVNHNENTGEKLHLAQEQLALAGDKIASLERSLNLYRDKYQTSLSNIELLECQVKMLEGELSGLISQEPENKGDHPNVRIYTSSCMIQEHQETLKRLSEVWQKVSEQDDLIQELRNKLACSNALFLQEKDERLHELEKKLSQVQSYLRKKETELEKQQCMMKELEMKVKEEKQDGGKAECEVLQAEVQKGKDCLEEAKQQLRLAAQQAAQYKEKASLAENNLADAEKKLQSCVFQDKQKANTIQEQQMELQELQKELLQNKEDLSHNRKQVEELTSQLGEALRKFEHADKERRQLQRTLAEEEAKINEMQDQIRQLQHQNRDLLSAKSKLEDELQEIKKLVEEKKGQLKKSKEQEKMREEELEAARQEAKKKDKMHKETLRKLEGENENLREEVVHYSTQLEASVSKYNAAQQVIQELNIQINQHKESITSLQSQLQQALQREKHLLQTMVSKEVYEDLSRKATACQDDLTRTLEKLNQATSEIKSLQRNFLMTQERKSQLEDEILAYEEKMKRLNVELKKLQGFHQESEIEVQAFDKKLEEMSNQVMQWQKQHQNDLKMLAAKETQLREFQEEMATLKETLLADEKEPCCLPQRSVTKETYRLHRDNDQIMCNMEQWAKEQKIANEKLGNKLREQVKYIAKLTGEKDHLHNVMVHLQQENKKLKSEIEEKKVKSGNTRLCKALGLNKLEAPQRAKMCGTLSWRESSSDTAQRMDITKYVGTPQCSGSSYC